MNPPLSADDLQRIFYEQYRRDKRWHEVDKPVVQKDVQRACWQAVLDAVRAERQAEIDSLNTALSKVAKRMMKLIEADAKR